MGEPSNKANIDRATVDGFGAEWAAFDQSQIGAAQYAEFFDSYFAIFPFETLPPDAEGFDLGCGSGRWAAGVAPRVGRLHCIDPAAAALNVARTRLRDHDNVEFHLAGVDDIPLADASQDFGYSLGVLHHVPDTQRGLAACVRKLKPGAPFLLYLYYAMDNRPVWYRMLWRLTEAGRKTISRLPFALRRRVTDTIAITVYWPLARLSLVADKLGVDAGGLPLSYYRRATVHTLRTDALDRFGTRLEQRFSRRDIARMMTAAGLGEIVFKGTAPFWTACGRCVAAPE